ncbi:hypothetical protein G6F50_015417 [Rhizopus delemar]|uniref:Uncharacterized protein n=1 Tax=Rhizopus delemar TaxID=936053 RepID=A0A9P7C486_9FUNG|nr:hypothetical protein G6F50_015417 [Rhizopus delemar]
MWPSRAGYRADDCGWQQPHRGPGRRRPPGTGEHIAAGRHRGGTGAGPQRAGQFHHQDRGQEPHRGRATGGGGAVPAAGQPACGDDHRAGDSAVVPVRGDRHEPLRHQRQPDEPGAAPNWAVH